MPALLHGLDFGSSLYKNLKSIHKIHSMIGSGVLVGAYTSKWLFCVFEGEKAFTKHFTAKTESVRGSEKIQSLKYLQKHQFVQ